MKNAGQEGVDEGVQGTVRERPKAQDGYQALRGISVHD